MNRLPIVAGAIALAASLAVGEACVNGRLDARVPVVVGGIEQVACNLVPLFVHGDQAVGIACSEVAPIVTGILRAFAAKFMANYTTVMPPCKLAPISDGRRGLGYVCETYAAEITVRLSADGGAP